MWRRIPRQRCWGTSRSSPAAVHLDVGLNISRMGMDLRIDATGREGVTDQVRPWGEIFEIQTDDGIRAATEPRAAIANRTEK